MRLSPIKNNFFWPNFASTLKSIVSGTGRKGYKILRAVISPLFVYMMDWFFGRKESFKKPLNHKAVFHHISMMVTKWMFTIQGLTISKIRKTQAAAIIWIDRTRSFMSPIHRIFSSSSSDTHSHQRFRAHLLATISCSNLITCFLRKFCPIAPMQFAFPMESKTTPRTGNSIGPRWVNLKNITTFWAFSLNHFDLSYKHINTRNVYLQVRTLDEEANPPEAVSE